MPTSTPEKVPVVIVAGSDCRAGPVPKGSEDLRFVVGYKGAELQIAGRCLARIIVEQARSSGAFDAIYLAGPRRVYRGLVDCEIIDTDGNLGENLQSAVRSVLKLHGRESRIAFLTCDILPTPEEIASLTAELTCEAAGGSDSGAEMPIPALSFALIRKTEGLGASDWKPKYRFRPAPGEEPISYLPCHLGILWPSRLRMGLLYRLMQLFYEERNRDYDTRGRRIIAGLMGTLLRRDFSNLLRFKAPTLTYTVLRRGLGMFIRWRRGDLDLQGLASGVAGVSVRRRYVKRWGRHSVRLVTSPIVSFAKDLDTHEELEELGRRLGSSVV